MPSLKEVKIPRGVKASIKGVKDLKSEDFFKLSEDSKVNILNDGIDKFRTFIETRRLTPELSDYMKLFEDIYRETGDPTVTPYLQLFDAMKSRNGSKLSRDVLETLQKDDPDTLAVYFKYPGEEVANIPGFDFYDYRRTGNGIIESAEPTTGVLSNNPINNAPPAETSSGVLTNPPPASELPKTKTIIRDPISDEEMVKLTYPKEGVVVGPDTSKPGVDTPLAEGNSAAGSSPEVKAAEETAKSEAVTGEAKTTPETPETEGALTGKDKKPAESSKGLFSRVGGHIGRNWGKYLGGVGLGTVGWGIIHDLASENSKLKSLFTEGDFTLDASQPHVKSLDQRKGAYMPERLRRFTTNEEYTPGKIPSHIPQDNLPSINESTASKKVKSQPQVINAPAPENNATADYVRAAYSSYIPSDAGRAYQKAIYGDPLELDRMRLQQQQQKWRDFVMRSGQSPAELVQRGLMPYDALQYI